MDVVSFLERHSPKTLNDFLGNKIQKQQMREFMRSKDDHCRIIIAPSGSGKTAFCDLLFKEFDVTVTRPCYNEYGSHKDLVQFLETSIKTSTIMDMFNRKPKVLFLDDVDVLLSQDRYSNSYLTTLAQKIQSKELNAKLVITCVSAEEKKLTDLKKKVDHIKLHCPPIGDCLIHVINVMDSEGYEVDQASLMELIKTMQCNIRNILTNLFTCIDMDDEADNRSYGDKNIFEVIEKVFQNSAKGFGDLDIALSSDPTLISYMMYDNFREYANCHYNFTQEEYSSKVQQVLRHFMDSSIIEADAFINNEWENMETANLIKCGSIRAMQNSMQKRSTAKKPFRVAYTTIMTRSSQHYANMKKVIRYANRNDMDHSNMALLSELAFENSKDKRWKTISKDEDGMIITSYMNNICDKDAKVHGRRVRKPFFPT